MMKRTSIALRYRTAWRELLHPLPIGARHDQWLKRDTVEINEAILRQPYFTIKGYAQPAFVDKAAAFSDASVGVETMESPQNANYTVQQQLRAPRHASSPARLRELREQLQFPSATGPMPATDTVQYEEEYGARLRPRYPESWDTVPPHQPSRVV